VKKEITFIVFFLSIIFNGHSNGVGKFYGTWTLIHGKGSEIELYNNLKLDIYEQGKMLFLAYKWGNSRFLEDTFALDLTKHTTQKNITNRVYPTNVFMGLRMPVGTQMELVYRPDKGAENLSFFTRYQVSGSQGSSSVQENHTLHLLEKGEILEYRISRSSRSGSDIVYYLKRPGTRSAFYLNLGNSWSVQSGLSTQASLLSLQGLVNREGPQLYFIYPEDWAFRFTPDVLNFIRTERYYSFHHLHSFEEVLEKFHKNVKGYVIWDRKVRTSLLVAFTLAGLKDGLVITEDQLPLMEKYGIPKLIDLRGKYSNQTDYEIFSQAYLDYGLNCNKHNIIWLGGESGSIMKPGVADWGVQQKSFFVNLSTQESDTLEYALANRILSDLEPYSVVFGWHSYKKDKERDYVKLTSHYGLRVEGLNTFPNLSFMSRVPSTEGFVFQNHHHVNPGENYRPGNKIYLAFIQTDGLGLGAWNQPGRGEIPYAWEVTMNWYWLAPSMLEYFYSQATENDYFIGALSGPGYLYPKAVPPKKLPQLIEMASNLMHKLDLKVFEIMDYSEGATVEGNTELTQSVMDAYYKGMPDAVGFVNGYAPAYSFDNREGQPLISYDYYLSPTRKKEAVIADLKELASINAKRPYFLLLHVREWSNISRVKGIIDGLGPKFEVVPLDVFLNMAGKNPTFKVNLLDR